MPPRLVKCVGYALVVIGIIGMVVLSIPMVARFFVWINIDVMELPTIIRIPISIVFFVLGAYLLFKVLRSLLAKENKSQDVSTSKEHNDD